MTNETRAALVLLKEQLAAAEEALASYDALVAALQHSAFGAGISDATAAAERSLSAVRALARRQREYLAEVQADSMAAAVASLIPAPKALCWSAATSAS